MTIKVCHSPPSYDSWWYADSARYEYVKSDLFWTLAILIIVNFWWSTKQVDAFPEKGKEPDTTAPQPGFWLNQRITSRLRQYLALLVCTLAFPLQLLHGSWVLKSAWRITFGLLKRTYPSIKPRILGFIIYSPITAVVLAGWAAVLGFGIVIIATQILVWAKLWEMKPSTPSTSRPKQLKDKPDGDGDWDEIKGNETEDSKNK
ncbi:hypothetical protein FAVG1_09308 [Fusarium avenaceum]|nr:hypothetical protein FAVG1_09308 [Fusarium avenaceum]